MALRIQLINDIVGALVIRHDDPMDINALSQTIKRSEDSDGVVYQIIFDLEFIKAGRRFIKQCYETAGGIDAIVLANLYERNPNNRKWILRGTGQVSYSNYDLGEIDVVVNIEQSGVERRVINLMEKDVDLETEVSENGSALPAQTIFDIPFHSKAILKLYEAKPNADTFEDDTHTTYTFPNVPLGPDTYVSSVTYVQIDNSTLAKGDLEQNFSTPFSSVFYDDITSEMVGAGDTTMYTDFLSESVRKTFRNPIYDAVDEGTLTIDLQLAMKHKMEAVQPSSGPGSGDVDICGSGILGNVEVFAWCEKRDKDDNIIFIDQIGQWDLTGCGGTTREGVFETKNYTNTIATVLGDKVYWYLTYRIYGTYDGPGQIPTGPSGSVIHTYTLEVDLDNTYLKMSNKTISAETTVSTPLIYEAIERCVQYYTNQVDCFRSTLLGRTDIGYGEDGEGALIAVPNGHRLRLKNDKQIFSSLKDLLEFVNAVYCIGWGFQIIDGKQYFVVEKKEFFYDKTTTVASLGKIFKPRKKAIAKRYYNQIEYGYNTKVEINQVNAVDEVNTIRRSSIPIVNTPNQLKVSTKTITAGYIIEYERRLYSSTKDGRYDDSNFAAVVIRDGLGFRSKKDEGYSLITGVYDSPSGYNYDISPARMRMNWRVFISSGLIRSFNKVCKFSSGEVNYTMVTQKTTESVPVAENGDEDLTNIEPIFDLEEYILNNVPMPANVITAILNNPYGVIEFQDKTGATFEGFLNPGAGIDYDAVKKIADIKLLKVFRP
jgi:hypothetical protein